MIKYKITKVNKLLEVNNDMVHNYYYVVYGNIYNKEHTRVKKFHFVLFFDIQDVMEYYCDYENVNEFGITEDDIKYYKNDLIGSIMDNYFYNVSYDDENFKEKLKEFFVYCNDTINDFNKIV